ncbi:MAG TPA: glutamate racemase [Gemmatimonadaceae bacterium]|nr:glutamate racemase [Gemmatimonadaceae bacterium]
MTSRAPIGVFDSGIGGLTVVAALTRRLPRESILYFGDTARVPYGPKSPDTVRRYASEISSWLLGEGVKSVVVACNTATAHALPELQAQLPVPVIGVIDPGAKAALEVATDGGIGVIGTAGTIASGAYARAIWTIAPAATVVSQACPLFVPLVEEGWTEHPATKLVAREYLAPLIASHVRAVVLGCTHYPLLRTVLAEVMGDGVALIDSADATAREVARVLEERKLAVSADAAAPTHRFVASDAPAQFLRLGQRFLGAAIERVETVTLG